MNGLGSDAFAMVWDGRELHGLNASGRSPAAWTPDYFRGKAAMPAKRRQNVPGSGVPDPAPSPTIDVIAPKLEEMREAAASCGTGSV